MMGNISRGGAEYERVAPLRCASCNGTDFERNGRVGLWDGLQMGGCIYEAKCTTCHAIWRSRSTPFICRDDPSSLTWRLETRTE
jgi:hypothetical protein